jgi:hypothetical protein
VRTLTFAVAMTMAAALHAESLEDWLEILRGESVSGVHDVTALIAGERAIEDRCAHAAGRNAVAIAEAYFACIKAERTRLWAQRLRDLFGDPGRH